MPENIPIVWLIAYLYLHDVALDHIIDVSVADCSIYTLPVINDAEDGLDFVRLWPHPLLEELRTPLGAKHEPTIPILVGFTFSNHFRQYAVWRKLQVIFADGNQFRMPREEVAADRCHLSF